MNLKERCLLRLVFLAFLSKILKQQLCQGQEKSIQRGQQLGFIYANFTDHFFHVLDVQEIDITPVQNRRQCLLHCVKNHRCFSTNIAVYPNSKSHLVCKLLPTDKYNSSTSFGPSQIFHHYSIYSPCESSPCKHGGTCRALYDTNQFSCDCLQYHVDENCEPKALPFEEKLNESPVCFGARNDQFGSFVVQLSGKIDAFKLVHVSGYVTCHFGSPVYQSNWGCGSGIFGDQVNVFITKPTNRIIMPSSQVPRNSLMWYLIPGLDSFSPNLVLDASDAPISVWSGDQLRLWYGEDLINSSEADNGGVTCCDIYGSYIELFT